MPEGFLADLVALFMVGCNIDEPAVELGLTPSPVELIPLAGSHRARARVTVPIALLPDAVARLASFEKLRAIPVRAVGYFGGSR